MTIIVVRKFFCKDYIIGDVYFNNEKTLICNSLEPSLSAVHPAIPCGSYPIEFRYSYKFNRYMPFLTNTRERVGIMLHAGNKPSDTLGCILLGLNTEKGMITSSRKVFEPIRSSLLTALDYDNEPSFVTIKNK